MGRSRSLVRNASNNQRNTNLNYTSSHRGKNTNNNSRHDNIVATKTNNKCCNTRQRMNLVRFDNNFNSKSITNKSTENNQVSNNTNNPLRKRKGSDIIVRQPVDHLNIKIKRRSRALKDGLQTLKKRIFRKRKSVSETDLDNEMDNYWMKSNNRVIVGKKLDTDMDDYWKQKDLLDQELTSRIDSALKSGRETKAKSGGVVV